MANLSAKINIPVYIRNLNQPMWSTSQHRDCQLSCHCTRENVSYPDFVISNHSHKKHCDESAEAKLYVFNMLQLDNYENCIKSL